MPTDRCILAIDQGTTGSTVALVDTRGRLKASVNNEFPQIYPRPGWVEHHAEEIWRNTEEVISAALADAGIAASDLSAVGLTNQQGGYVDDFGDPDFSKKVAIGVEVHQTFGNGGNTQALFFALDAAAGAAGDGSSGDSDTAAMMANWVRT